MSSGVDVVGGAFPNVERMGSGGMRGTGEMDGADMKSPLALQVHSSDDVSGGSGGGSGGGKGHGSVVEGGRPNSSVIFRGPWSSGSSVGDIGGKEIQGDIVES